MKEDLASADEEIRRHVTDALERLDVDVAGNWQRFSSHLRAERRRSVASRIAVAAAVLAFSLTAGRPLVVTGGNAIVRFLSDVTETTSDWVGESIEERIPGLGRGGPTSRLTRATTTGSPSVPSTSSSTTPSATTGGSPTSSTAPPPSWTTSLTPILSSRTTFDRRHN